MRNRLLIFSICISSCLLVISCSSSKHVNYFSNYTTDSSHTFIHESYEVPIQVGDRLSITVSALNPASAAPYNFTVVPGASGVGAGAATGGIVVEQDGKIVMPQLGSIKVEGLTISQLRDLLVSKLRTYLTDPIVSVDYVNFKVTVMGEVARPLVITAPNGRLNVLEALAQAGDLTTYSKRYPIMVIRENKGRREFGYINLLSKSVFSSPYYRLQQNDIIYVQAVENKPTFNQEVNTRRLQLTTTVISLVTSVAFFVFAILNR